MGNITQGSPACGLSNNAANPGMKLFMVKWFYGNDYLTIQISKQSWRIPKSARGEIEIKFDNGTPFIGTAHAHPEGNIMELPVPISQINNFMQEFRDSNRMTVRFVSGNEQPWWADMAGSRPVGLAFERCILSYLDQMKSAQPTQPYSAQPTQPFSTQPTQPYSTRPVQPRRADPTQPVGPVEPQPSVPVRKPVLRVPADDSI
jgi:hypothetical protein